MVTRVCRVLTDGASRIISSAYRKTAAQHAPILQPLLALLTIMKEMEMGRKRENWVERKVDHTNMMGGIRLCAVT